MADIFSDELFRVARDLAVAGLVYLAYKTAKDAGNNQGRRAALLKGWGYCIGIAIFAAVMLGRPSCEDADPLYGGCSQQDDDGYIPSSSQRGATFLYWMLLFGVPVTMGVMAALPHAANPWIRPDKSRL